MKTTTNGRFAILTLSTVLVTTLLAGPADAAQSRSADSRRLDQLRTDVQTELRRVDEQPPASSARLRDRLEDLRDEVGYLRVVQRRGQKINDREYRELESRLQNIRLDMRQVATRTDGSRTRALGGSYDLLILDRMLPVTR